MDRPTSEMEPSEEKEFCHQQHCLKAFLPYLFDQLSEAFIGILALEFKFKNIFSNGKLSYECSRICLSLRMVFRSKYLVDNVKIF